MIDASNSTSGYLGGLFGIDNIHFEHMVHRIYFAWLQLNKANASDAEATFLDLKLSINNDTVSFGMYDGRGGFGFDNFPFLSGGVPLIVFIYRNLFALPDHLRMLVTSIVVKNSWLSNSLGQTIGIINSARRFSDFTVYTVG